MKAKNDSNQFSGIKKSKGPTGPQYVCISIKQAYLYASILVISESFQQTASSDIFPADLDVLAGVKVHATSRKLFATAAP